jgi:hypothetical protein
MTDIQARDDIAYVVAHVMQARGLDVAEAIRLLITGGLGVSG